MSAYQLIDVGTCQTTAITGYTVGTKYHVEDVYTKMNSLAGLNLKQASKMPQPCPVAPPQSIRQELKAQRKAMYRNAACKQEETEENTMNDIQTTQLRHLRDRLCDARSEKFDAARTAFGFNTALYPRNPQEAVDFIKAGKYTIAKGEAENDDGEFVYYGAPVQYLRFKDTTVTKDEAGFEAASKAIELAFKNAKDSIIIKTPDEGLKALQEFEAATFH